MPEIKDQMRQSAGSSKRNSINATWTALAPVIFLVFTSLLVFVPWRRPFKTVAGLSSLRVDLSYLLTMPQLFLDKAQYGPDIVFTYGPLGWICCNWTPFKLHPWAIVLGIALSLVFSAGMYYLIGLSALRYRWWTLAPLFVLGSMVLEGFTDYYWISFALLAAVFYVRGGRITFLTAALACSAALVGLVKFTFLMMGLVCFGVLALWDILRKQPPRLSFLFALSLIFFWFLAGQNPVHLPIWILRCVELSSSYGEAMAKGFYQPYRGVDVAIFLVGALVPLGTMLWNRRQAPALWVLAMCFGAAAFMQHKHAWGGNQIENAAITLLFLGLFYVCLIVQWSRATAFAMLLGVLAPCVILVRYDALPLYDYLKPVYTAERILQMARTLMGQISAATDGYEPLLASVRNTVPLPGITGSADAIPNISGVIAAYHKTLSYRPRPAYLGINAHTAKLAQANGTFLKSSQAPDWLLFEVEPEGERFNKRYPASVEGPAWLEAITRYEVSNFVGNIAVMSKREPKTFRMSSVIQHTVSMGEPLQVPPGLIWAEMDIRRTAFGHLTEFLYKTPHVLMEIKTDIGAVHEFQLLSNVARGGFILSPFINTTDEFTALAHGELQNLDAITSLRVRVDGPQMMYAPMVEVKLARVEFEDKAPQGPPDAVKSLRRTATGAQTCMFPPELQWDSQAAKRVLLAHAPCDIQREVTGGELHLGYGLRDDSQNSDGAEFQVRQNGRIIWSQQVKPGSGEQRAVVPVARGTVRLITLPGPSGSNAYDHTYWSEVDDRR